MADYKIIGTKSAIVTGGDADNFDTDSAFSRPRDSQASSGAQKPARFMQCEFGVTVAVANNLGTFISLNDGRCWSNDFFNASGSLYGWPKSFLLAATKPFSVRATKTGESGASINNYKIKTANGTFTKTYRNDSAAGADGVYVLNDNFGVKCVSTQAPGGPSSGGGQFAQTVYYPSWTDDTSNPGSYNRFPKSGVVSNFSMEDATWDEFKTAMLRKGYAYIGGLNDWEWIDENKYSGRVYIGGIALFNNEVPEYADWISAAHVDISGIGEYLEYYPWARFDGSEWVSHNASGHSLKRHNGTTWVDVKNSFSSDASRSKGFRHDGDGFAKSPKHGEGA